MQLAAHAKSSTRKSKFFLALWVTITTIYYNYEATLRALLALWAPKSLNNICQKLTIIADNYSFIFPLSPRSRQVNKMLGLTCKIPTKLHKRPPIDGAW